MNKNFSRLNEFISKFEKEYGRKPKFYKIKVRRNNSIYYSYLSYPNRSYYYFGYYNRASRYLGITLSELCLEKDTLLLYLAYHDHIFVEITDYDEIIDHLLFRTPEELGKVGDLKNKQLSSDYGFCIAPSENKYLEGAFKNTEFYKLQNIQTGNWLCFNLKDDPNSDLAIVVPDNIFEYKKYKEIVRDIYKPIKVKLPTTYTRIFYNFEDFGLYISRF